MSVVITEDDFDIAAEHNKLKSASVGAIVTFTGTVRDLGGSEAIEAMTLEHYPGMTESEIDKISKDLSESMGANLKFDYKVDKDLIGGLKLQLGSFMIDTSIKNKLKKFEQAMIEN